MGKSCGKFLQENLLGKSCGKFLQEIIVGNYCRTRRRGKIQFEKGSDWWKFSNWNRVMGSQPIRIQLGKILPTLAIFGTFFAIFRPLTGNKTSPNNFCCRGGSKLQFGGSYVKIRQELASECIFYLGEIFFHIWELSLSNIKNVTSQHVDY